MSAPGCRCGGTGRLGADLEVRCPCTRENSDDTLDRVTAERDQLRAHNLVLEKQLLESRAVAERFRTALHRLAGQIQEAARG